MRAGLVFDAFVLPIQTLCKARKVTIFAMMHIVLLHLKASCDMKLQTVIFPEADVLN